MHLRVYLRQAGQVKAKLIFYDVVYGFLKIYLTPGGLLLYNIILEVIYENNYFRECE